MTDDFDAEITEMVRTSSRQREVVLAIHETDHDPTLEEIVEVTEDVYTTDRGYSTHRTKIEPEKYADVLETLRGLLREGEVYEPQNHVYRVTSPENWNLK